MAEAQIECLSRLTAGDIGKDQAIIDYFYYDEKINFTDIISDGFFDKLWYKFKPNSRISCYCLANNTPPTPPTRKRMELVVAGFEEYSPPRSYKKVKLVLGPDTMGTNDPITNVWNNYKVVFEGFVTWVTPPLPNPNPGVNVINVNNPLIDFDAQDKIIFSQPNPGDVLQSHMVRAVTLQSSNIVYALWAPLALPGPPVTVSTDPPQFLTCEMYIKIFKNILLPNI